MNDSDILRTELRVGASVAVVSVSVFDKDPIWKVCLCLSLYGAYVNGFMCSFLNWSIQVDGPARVVLFKRPAVEGLPVPSHRLSWFSVAVVLSHFVCCSCSRSATAVEVLWLGQIEILIWSASLSSFSLYVVTSLFYVAKNPIKSRERACWAPEPECRNIWNGAPVWWDWQEACAMNHMLYLPP